MPELTGGMRSEFIHVAVATGLERHLDGMVDEVFRSPEDLSRRREWLVALLAHQVHSLGEETQEVIETRMEIAYCTGELGDHRHALDLDAQLLGDADRILGPDHPDTLSSRHSVAYHTGQLGNHQHALDLYAQLVDDAERILGPDDPLTRSSASGRHLAQLLLGERPPPKEIRDLIAADAGGGSQGPDQKRVAACSARGERTPLDRVTWPNSRLPFIFSIRAAIPPYGEM